MWGGNKGDDDYKVQIEVLETVFYSLLSISIGFNMLTLCSSAPRHGHAAVPRAP